MGGCLLWTSRSGSQKNNIEKYTFFTKPIASDICHQAETALNQNTLVQSLSNEVARRLDKISNTMCQDGGCAG
jgi:hypothetical protein